MGLLLEESLNRELPTTVKVALTKMDQEKQMMFTEDFKKKKKSKHSMLLLAILLPGIQLILLNKGFLGLMFWLSFGLFGFWYVFEIFYTFKRVSEYNDDLAMEILRNHKLIG